MVIGLVFLFLFCFVFLSWIGTGINVLPLTKGRWQASGIKITIVSERVAQIIFTFIRKAKGKNVDMDKENQISKMLKDVHKILSSVHLRKTLYL